MAGNWETLLNELNRQSSVEREKKLIEGAKKEGGVVIYSSENATLLQRYEAAFTKRYPFSKQNTGAQVAIESERGC